MNELFSKLPKPLQSILNGSVPDEEWELKLTPTLESSLEKARQQWEYLGWCFREARQDKRCLVPLMPTLMYCALVIGRVPSLPMATQIISASPLAVGDMEARTYSAFTGFLRELCAGVEAVKQGYRVFKHPKLDLENGTDWIIRKEVSVQVSMAGVGSASHWNNRKCHKTSEDVIVLTASPSSGLAVVSSEDISNALSAAFSRAMILA